MSDTIDGATAAPDDERASGDTVEYVAQKKHSLALRWMHWLNFPLLMIMMYSGMRIYWADLRDPYALGIGGWQLFEFWPDGVNSGLQLERKLAKGIAFHLSFGWFFVINGLAYTFYLSRRGEWRHIVPDFQSVKDAGRTVAHDLHLTKKKPVQGKYNSAQQLTYSAVLVIAFLLVTSGFAIYKPGQLAWLEALFTGYDHARFVHFTMTILLMSFFAVHILQVVRAGWSNFASMITGYRLERADDPEVAPPSAFGPDESEDLSSGTADERSDA
ncbi:MAG: cytochrome b/b6 domain-containing protein [Ilumatobacter sp.]